MTIFLDTLGKTTDFSGRASRREWGIFVLCSLVIGLPLIALDIKLDWFDHEWRIGPLTATYLLFTFLPNTALTLRRLHDSNKSGWWALTTVIPYLGIIIYFGLMQLEGTKGPNQYGDDPLGREPSSTNDALTEKPFVPKFNKDE